jgi:hypothetical protein
MSMFTLCRHIASIIDGIDGGRAGRHSMGGTAVAAFPELRPERIALAHLYRRLPAADGMSVLMPMSSTSTGVSGAVAGHV